MPATTIITSIGALDTLDTGISSNASTLSNINTDLQIASALTGAANMANPFMSGSAITAGESALASGLAVLKSDVSNASISKLTVLGDLVTVVGDGLTVTGAVASSFSKLYPAALALSEATEAAGNILTFAGLAINHPGVVLSVANSSITAITSELNGFLSAINTKISSEIGNSLLGSSVVNPFINSDLSSTSNALSGISNVISNISSGSFSSNVGTASNALLNNQTSLTNLFASSGLTAQNVTESVTSASAAGGSITVSGPTGVQVNLGLNFSARPGTTDWSTSTSTSSGSVITTQDYQTTDSSVINTITNVGTAGAPANTQAILTIANGTTSDALTGTGATAFLTDGSLRV